MKAIREIGEKLRRVFDAIMIVFFKRKQNFCKVLESFIQRLKSMAF